MISKLKWHWLDWLIVLAIFIALVRIFAPGSGLDVDIHAVFHVLGTIIAALFNLA